MHFIAYPIKTDKQRNKWLTLFASQIELQQFNINPDFLVASNVNVVS